MKLYDFVMCKRGIFPEEAMCPGSDDWEDEPDNKKGGDVYAIDAKPLTK